MNGVIHNCTHGNDPSRKLTEPEMILKVFDYLDKLVHIIQPQQQLFMALDGTLLLRTLELTQAAQRKHLWSRRTMQDACMVWHPQLCNAWL